MPWFPDFANAIELARREARAAGQADPVAQYLSALNGGHIHGPETVWPGQVVVHDPALARSAVTGSCGGSTLPIGGVVGPADVAALAVHIMTITALTGATYDIDGGQQLL
jgi:hypothetical protein